MNNDFQVFITVDEEGNLTSYEVSQFSVRTDPCDFFFIVSAETANNLIEKGMGAYRVVINKFKPELVLIEQPTESEVIE